MSESLVVYGLVLFDSNEGMEIVRKLTQENLHTVLGGTPPSVRLTLRFMGVREDVNGLVETNVNGTSSEDIPGNPVTGFTRVTKETPFYGPYF